MTVITEPLAEKIEHSGSLLAMIVYRQANPPATSFLTVSELPFQAGFVVYPAGGVVVPHTHKQVERRVVGTSEAILVRSGACLIDIYTSDRELLATRKLSAGDLVLLYSGGHGFRMLEDCVLFEIKQGPYSGLDEKERFSPAGG